MLRPVVAGAGIEPADRAYETPLIARSPAGVTGRTWSRRRGSNPLLLGYGPSALPSGPRRRDGSVVGGSRTLIAGMARRDPCPLDDDHEWMGWTPGRDSHPRVAVCSRVPESSATGRWLPARGSNSRLPGNSRTSVPLDHLALLVGLAYRDGESNPGLRGEGPVSCPLDDRGECGGGSGATRTPRGLEDPYLFSRQAPDPAGSLPRGMGLAGTSRTCDTRLRRAVLWSTELRRVCVSTAGVEPASPGFVDRCLDPLGHVDMLAGRHRRDLHPRPPA